MLNRPTYTAEQMGQRVDALALRMGTKVTASVLMLACLVVILIGAQSLLTTMEDMDRDMQEMNEQVAIANGGVALLNETMESLGPTAQHLEAIVASVRATNTEVGKSTAAIGSMSTSTGTLNERITTISTDTTSMRESLQSTASSTGELGSTISTLNTKIGPLVTTQAQMLTRTRGMRGGLDDMNASLAYVVRILNYMTAPPTMQPFAVRMELPPMNPQIPGIKIAARPVSVFDRMAWAVYQGP